MSDMVGKNQNPRMNTYESLHLASLNVLAEILNCPEFFEPEISKSLMRLIGYYSSSDHLPVTKQIHDTDGDFLICLCIKETGTGTLVWEELRAWDGQAWVRAPGNQEPDQTYWQWFNPHMHFTDHGGLLVYFPEQLEFFFGRLKKDCDKKDFGLFFESLNNQFTEEISST